ncbi:glutathione-disulfide reductase [Pseudenhygromyxa sp. WMMC2535]|uniref:glutathione-disulfide reductase n=1 Tax=Pseudenhygromyxa sp. WMMC2535 TaxID=2712867 RepID=UPI001552DCF1|nr:glutathione-disulfide reductase [Pseudenhygromyxa sp. WMMC2535]NVB43717.1 glutathione-disulfide reductase [Pseudenhygromyxa sp. WMMC2535]NVB43790.1 glutathione-disulfide reductase [Pseudenhygromyxa sp. WMMC2535]
MPEFDFDLFTIGAGSGGVAASRRAGEYGAKVAICEGSRVGGTCVMRGCVPKKLLVYAASFAEHFADAAGFGWSVPEPKLDWPKLMAAKEAELDRLEQIYRRLLRDSKVELIEGRGKLIDAHTVEVGDKRYTAKYILIATGGWPELPDIPGIDLAITSNEALELPELPKRVTIVGGGYIGVEFAGIFNAAGAKVTMLLRGDNVLRGFDDEIRERLAEEMNARGVEILTEVRVRSIDERSDGSLSLLLDHDEFHETDALLYATGRKPASAGLGLEMVGIETRRDAAIVVDERNRTAVPNIYAIGDVTHRINLTPVAIAEGRALAETLFNRKPLITERDNIPTAVFSRPPVATVGLTEQEARERHESVEVYCTRFRPMKATLSGRAERITCKLVVDKPSGVVLGAHMVGEDAPEIIQGLAIALKCGATKRDFDRTMGIHPSAAEEFVTMRFPVPDTD